MVMVGVSIDLTTHADVPTRVRNAVVACLYDSERCRKGSLPMPSRCCCFTNVLFIPTLSVYPMEKWVYPVSGVRRKCTMSLNPT